MPFEFTCERCGKSFTRPGRHRQPYCSYACYTAPRPGIPQDDGTVLVPLSGSRYATIDAQDAECILAFKWSASPEGYARRKRQVADGPGAFYIYMHREIAGTPDGMKTDHQNGNTLDNRRDNLRWATNAQNGQNKTTSTKSMSGFRGVTFHGQSGLWHASIHAEGKRYSLRYYNSPEDAARAYDQAAKELHGPFASLNFPDDH